MKYTKIALLSFCLMALPCFATQRKAVTENEPIAPCTPFTNIGEACIWQGGVELPVRLESDPTKATMMTLVLPVPNAPWELRAGDFKIRLRYVYDKNCSYGFSVWYFTDIKYDNTSLCTIGD